MGQGVAKVGLGVSIETSDVPEEYQTGHVFGEPAP